ncbi:MAG: hypothetical protein K2R98_04445 [Gemmataceae bacterium]|nr:hypothetical protein [Gemmataceae bacterium]
MISERLSRLLTAYVDGELGMRKRKAVSRLLRRSSDARKLYRRIKKDSLILRRLPKHTLQLDLSDTIMDRITKLDIRVGVQAGRPAPRLGGWKSWWTGVAAAVLLCAIGGVSYLYFAADNGGQPFVENTDGPQQPKVIAEKPDGGSNPNAIFAFPNLKVPQFQQANARVPLILWPRDMDPESAEQLQQELRKDPSHRLDLFSTDSTQALDRLQSAAKAQGIAFTIDPEAQMRVKGQIKTTFALYVENMTPGEVVQLLKQLGADDKKQGTSPFAQVVVAATTEEELAKVLCGTAKDFAPPSQRGVEHGTLGEIVHSLPGGPGAKAERTMIVVPYGETRTKPFKAVKNLLDGYRESRPGTVQLLVVLWGNS